MEEVSWDTKIILITISIAACILLATNDRLIKMVRRSPKSSEKK
jgi:hypothetical protein